MMMAIGSIQVSVKNSGCFPCGRNDVRIATATGSIDGPLLLPMTRQFYFMKVSCRVGCRIAYRKLLRSILCSSKSQAATPKVSANDFLLQLRLQEGLKPQPRLPAEGEQKQVAYPDRPMQALVTWLGRRRWRLFMLSRTRQSPESPVRVLG